MPDASRISTDAAPSVGRKPCSEPELKSKSEKRVNEIRDASRLDRRTLEQLARAELLDESKPGTTASHPAAPRREIYEVENSVERGRVDILEHIIDRLFLGHIGAIVRTGFPKTEINALLREAVTTVVYDRLNHILCGSLVVAVCEGCRLIRQPIIIVRIPLQVAELGNRNAFAFFPPKGIPTAERFSQSSSIFEAVIYGVPKPETAPSSCHTAEFS